MGEIIPIPVWIIQRRGSILHAETCKILSLTENPRWSPSVAIRHKNYHPYPLRPDSLPVW